jgi:formylglycine-generating enzyme
MQSNTLTVLLSGLLILASSCGSKKKSSTTGWEYNNSKNGGFEVNTKFQEQITGPC